MSATFVARPNRFLVIARIHSGSLVRVASRDPGRLRELLVPGAELRLAPADREHRRTSHTMVLVRKGRVWVSMIPALANRILEAALARGGVPGLRGARVMRREVAHGRSRFDFLLAHRGVPRLTEVKSATLVEGGRALFPDAPTQRGARHVRDLTPLGGRARVVFIIQRSDARSLSPCAERDPDFARALREAARAGVRILAYTCRVSPRGCRLDLRIPVELPYQ